MTSAEAFALRIPSYSDETLLEEESQSHKILLEILATTAAHIVWAPVYVFFEKRIMRNNPPLHVLVIISLFILQDLVKMLHLIVYLSKVRKEICVRKLQRQGLGIPMYMRSTMNGLLDGLGELLFAVSDANGV